MESWKTIETESDYVAAARALEHEARPPWVLRLLMRALEGYRSQRKMGWSRPQNKVGVLTYRAYRLDPEEDASLLADTWACLSAEFDLARTPYLDFAKALFEDRKLMAFVFCQDVSDDQGRYETVTMSLGRVSAVSKRYRDRLDLLLDARVQGGMRGGLSRVRTVIDPFRNVGGPHEPWAGAVDEPATPETRALLIKLAAFDAEHMTDSAKRWEHWTSRYVDYFGARTSAVEGTLFPDHIDLMGLSRPRALATHAGEVAR